MGPGPRCSSILPGVSFTTEYLTDPTFRLSFSYDRNGYFNRPEVRVCLNKKETITLLDGGADISMVTLDQVQLHSTSQLVESLGRSFRARAFNEVDGPGSEALDRNPSLRINSFVMVEVRICDFCFIAPLHIYPGPLSMPIVGNDLLGILGAAVDSGIAKVLIRLYKPLPNGQTKLTAPHLEVENSLRQSMAYNLRNKMVAPLGRQGMRLALDSVRSISTERELPVKYPPIRLQEGLVLLSHEHLAYPEKETVIAPGEHARIMVRSKSFKLHHKMEYEIRGVERAPFYDVIPVNGVLSVYTHKTDDSASFPITLTSTTGVTLKPDIACIIISRVGTATVASLRDGVADGPVSYPEISAFKPIPFENFPFPNEMGVWPDVPDWTPHEIEEAEKDYDRWVKEENGKIYLCPNDKVRLLHKHSKVSRGQRVLIAQMLSKLPDIWYNEESKNLPGVPITDVVIRVRLLDDKPVFKRVSHMGPKQRKVAQEEIAKWLKMGIYKHSFSPYSCNITWATKKDSLELRMCINYAPINAITEKDRFPMPRTEDLLMFLEGATFLTATDIKLGFHNFCLHPDDTAKLAFSTPDGHYEPLRLPFGWCNGPPAFMRQMGVSHAGFEQVVKIYMDDAVFRGSGNLKLHIMQFCTTAFNDWRRGLRYEPKKAQVACETLQFLGFAATGEGIMPSPKPNIFQKMLDRKHNCLKAIQRTVGSLQWFRRFVPAFSYMIKPILHQLKRAGRLGDACISFGDECRESIRKVEEAITRLPMLHHPRTDLAKHIYISIGNYAFATSIWQEFPDKQKPQVLVFWSKIWPLNIESYNRPERYALAVRETLIHHAYLLSGSPAIYISTSDPAFKAIAGSPDSWSSRLQRLLAYTCQYTCHFRLSNDPLCQPMVDLDSAIPADEGLDPISPAEELYQNQPFCPPISPGEILKQNMVYIDGACASIAPGKKQGSWGRYVRSGSPLNKSGLCEFPPFTNNRAELEALLHLLQDNTILIDPKKPLIVVSDSTYLCDGINKLWPNWTRLELAHENDYVWADKNHKEVYNGDLWRKITDLYVNFPIHLVHAARAFTAGADALARAELVARREELTGRPFVGAMQVPPMTITTRSRNRPLSPPPTEEEPRRYYPMDPSDYTEDPEIDIFVDDDDEDTWGLEAPLAVDQQPEPIPEEEVEEPIYPFEQDSRPISLPDWERDLIPYRQPIPSSLLRRLVHPPLRLEGPHLNEFSHVMMILADEQNKDEELIPIIKHLNGGCDPLLNKLDLTMQRYKIEEHTRALTIELKQQQKRFVVPQSLQPVVLALFHKAAGIGSHSNAEVTLMHLRRYFYWERMDSQTKSYVLSCQTCIAAKKPSGKLPGFLTPAPVPKGPLFKLHADTMRGLPVSSSYQNVLIVQCTFSKMIFATPLSSLAAGPTMQALVNIFTRFGPPQIFVADRGGEFCSDAMVSFLKLWGILPIFSEAYNPQANGQAEAAVKIVSRRLRTALHQLTMDRERLLPYPMKAWLKYLPYVVMSYNSTPNRITGMSPYEVLFGRPFPYPMALPEEACPKPTDPALADHLIALRAGLQAAKSRVTERLKQRREQIKKMFDKFRRPLRINEGDYAYVYYPKTTILPKLHPPTYGPFPVVKIDYRKGTEDVTGVHLHIGEDKEGKPIVKRFARGRVHPLSYTHRDINWDRLAKFAQESLEASDDEDVQHFLHEADRSIDDAFNTSSGGAQREGGRQRRVNSSGLLTDIDLALHRDELLSWTEDSNNESIKKLYESRSRIDPERTNRL